MALDLGTNFRLQSEEFNFERDSFATLAEMKAFPLSSVPDGFTAFCEQDFNHYIMCKGCNPSDETGYWRNISTVTDFFDNPVDEFNYSRPVAYGPWREDRMAIVGALTNKVDKVTGKGLSTNDYTTAEKQKLASLSNYNDSSVVKSIKINGETKTPTSGLVDLGNVGGSGGASKVTELTDVSNAGSASKDTILTANGDGTFSFIEQGGVDVANKADKDNSQPYTGEVLVGNWDANGVLIANAGYRSIEFDCNNVSSVYALFGASSNIKKITLMVGEAVLGQYSSTNSGLRLIIPDCATTCKISMLPTEIGSVRISYKSESSGQNTAAYADEVAFRKPSNISTFTSTGTRLGLQPWQLEKLNESDVMSIAFSITSKEDARYTSLFKTVGVSVTTRSNGIININTGGNNTTPGLDENIPTKRGDQILVINRRTGVVKSYINGRLDKELQTDNAIRDSFTNGVFEVNGGENLVQFLYLRIYNFDVMSLSKDSVYPVLESQLLSPSLSSTPIQLFNKGELGDSIIANPNPTMYWNSNGRATKSLGDDGYWRITATEADLTSSGRISIQNGVPDNSGFSSNVIYKLHIEKGSFSGAISQGFRAFPDNIVLDENRNVVEDKIMTAGNTYYMVTSSINGNTYGGIILCNEPNSIVKVMDVDRRYLRCIVSLAGDSLGSDGIYNGAGDYLMSSDFSSFKPSTDNPFRVIHTTTTPATSLADVIGRITINPDNMEAYVCVSAGVWKKITP